MDVRFARHEDVPAIEALRRKEWEAVGFCPLDRYHMDIDGKGGVLLVVEENGDIAGFLHGTHGTHYSKVLQAAVWEDARRIEHGKQLVDAFKGIALKKGQFGLKCRAAVDLDSNAFWDGIGFELVGTSMGRHLWKPSTPQSRLVNLWDLTLVPRLLDPANRSQVAK